MLAPALSFSYTIEIQIRQSPWKESTHVDPQQQPDDLTILATDAVRLGNRTS